MISALVMYGHKHETRLVEVTCEGVVDALPYAFCQSVTIHEGQTESMTYLVTSKG